MLLQTRRRKVSLGAHRARIGALGALGWTLAGTLFHNPVPDEH